MVENDKKISPETASRLVGTHVRSAMDFKHDWRSERHPMLWFLLAMAGVAIGVALCLM